jgi:hypothetical protein
MSVLTPQFNAVNPELERNRYHVPDDGRDTAMSAFPFHLCHSLRLSVCLPISRIEES